MPRIQIRKAAKAAAKKATKKVAKKVTKKPAKKVGKTKVYTSTLDVEESPKDNPEEATRDTYAEAGNVNTHNALLLQAPNPVVTARDRVIGAVRHLINAAIDSFTARNEEEPVRAYVRSVQEMASREFDMALHLLESEIRR